MSERIQGTVKWFSDEKGYGFIERHDGGDDVFLHFRELRQTGFRSVEDNTRVEFDVEQGPKGPRAIDVIAV
jgi:CspA family cold shock protein